MNKQYKEIARYLLLIVVMLGAYEFINDAYELELKKDLSMQFAGIVGTYLATWGFIVKWFFETKVSD